MSAQQPDKNRSHNTAQLHPTPAWLELVKAIPHLLWAGLAIYAFVKLFPELQGLLRDQGVSKLQLFNISLELTQIPKVKAPENVRNNPLFEQQQISKDDQLRIIERFQDRQTAEKLHSASLLWVDDEHPQKNVLERRVLVAAGTNIDLARSTTEAFEWLGQSNYDVVITDNNRENLSQNPVAECFSHAGWIKAGCGLLKKISVCYSTYGTSGRRSEECNDFPLTRKAKMPHMIIYSGDYHPEYGLPPFAFGWTNRADQLFNLIMDALRNREVNKIVEGPR